MTIELHPEKKAADALVQLRELKSKLESIRGSGASPQDLLNRWREWSAQALLQEANILSGAGTQRLLLGKQFELLHLVSYRDQAPTIASLINTELQLRIDTLNASISEIEEFQRSLSDLVIVIDTSVMMNAGPRVAAIKWDDVVNAITREASFVVPIRVVEELDGLKDRGSADQKNTARHALKWLSDTMGGRATRVPFPPEIEKSDSEPGRSAGEANIRVLVDDLSRVALVDGDRDIIDRALQLRPYTERVILVTMDLAMTFRARALGLEAVRLPHDQIPKRKP
ncbi:PIN domain-containing protein [Microbacterium testaceum]|uniref:PIN domain-containing protein n=1 Tax=Microbacterium testaceum TaxID=2033 RepID=UPI0022E0E636|nr:PIN domain-containing protein [Microbacterium testaceum]